MDRSKEKNVFLSTKNALYIAAASFFVTTILEISQYDLMGHLEFKELRDEYDMTLDLWSNWTIFLVFLIVTLFFMFYPTGADTSRKLRVGEIMVMWV